METTLHSIFLGKTAPTAHDEFIKFSKGEFKDKYMIEAKKQKDAWSIKTSPEYANSLVRMCLESTSKTVEVKGVIVSTFNMQQEAQKFLGNGSVKGIKQFMGIKQIQIEGNVEAKKMIELMEAYPRAFFALTFKTDNAELKIKPKAPKSAKPAAGGDKGPKVDFCSLKTSDAKIAGEILFDTPEAKLTTIKHSLIIKEIIIPKGVSDPVQMREKSIRKGTIKRIINSDGKEIISEADFSA
ncbi:MAG TPA: hypothetical protein VHA12_02515 [Candidatus Nanoarchaeia archaeon]|nr:hypothetical protein [Candidatus Nanoarchaeia archaeon]